MKKHIISLCIFACSACKMLLSSNNDLSWITNEELVCYPYNHTLYLHDHLINRITNKGGFDSLLSFLNTKDVVYYNSFGKYPNPYIRLYKSQVYYYKYLQTGKIHDSLLQKAVDTLGIATISSFRRFYSVPRIKRDSIYKPYFDTTISLKVFDDTVMLHNYLSKIDSGKVYLRAYDKMRLDIIQYYIFPKIYAECKYKNVALLKCLVLYKLLTSFSKSPHYKVDTDLLFRDSCKNSDKAFYYNPTFDYDLEKMKMVCIDSLL